MSSTHFLINLEVKEEDSATLALQHVLRLPGRSRGNREGKLRMRKGRK